MFTRPARVIAISHPDAITAAELAKYDPQAGERLLFKTTNSKTHWKTSEFLKRYVHINAEAARFLADRRVRCVGVDYLSVGAIEGDGVETHRILLSAGIWIIEGLNLEHVDPGNYELVCLPLKIVGGDGAPARAVLRPKRQ